MSTRPARCAGASASRRGEGRALDLEHLGPVLLDVVGARDGVLERGGDLTTRAAAAAGSATSPCACQLVAATGAISARRRRALRVGSGSHTRTFQPARANTLAQARPIRPATDDGDDGLSSGRDVDCDLPG